MKKFINFFLSKILILMLLSPKIALATIFDDNTKKLLNETAHRFMQKNNLILPDEEQNFPNLGILIKWQLYKIVPIENQKNTYAIVMALCSKSQTNEDCGLAYEVLGLVKSKKIHLKKFEEIISVPSSIIARIGKNPSLNQPQVQELSYYYVKLKREDTISAMKSIIGKIHYAGFSGVAVYGKKASFDPSKNRHWHIKDAHYSLRRGLTAEALDIQAFQLDGLDETDGFEYWKGCIKPNETLGQCEVAPWGQATILGIHK